MLRSMTAFARKEQSTPFGQIAWEIRSVNHRYLEPSFRLPEEFRALEGALREKLGKVLNRGKVDCTLRYKPTAATAEEIIVNEKYLQQLIAALKKVDAITETTTTLRSTDLLRWPGVTEESEQDHSELHKVALSIFNEALNDVVASRESEGERLRPLITERCTTIGEIVTGVRGRRPQVLAALEAKLKERLVDVADRGDPGRLEQELVIYATKLDVDEELDRLECHLQEVEKVLKTKKPVGRRLDFLMQEFNREANTLCSKSGDAELTRLGLSLKTLIDQMREQVQNVE